MLTVFSKLNPDANIAPTAIPTKSELYTSFVINASAIAMNDGTSDQNVAYSEGDGIAVTYLDIIPSAMTTSATTPMLIILVFLFFKIFPPRINNFLLSVINAPAFIRFSGY